MAERIMHGFPSREEALEDFFKEWEAFAQTEYVSLDDAVGRITAEPLLSKNTLPVYRSSALDGIAVRSSDFQEGIPDTSQWREGIDYVRADTGDDFDDSFDAIIIIENVTLHDDGSIELERDVSVEAGINVRPAGSTINKGDLLMDEGLPVRPTDLAALAMGGIAMVPVRRKPKVAFIPTGSELVPPGIAPHRGQNIDANSLMVKHMLIEYGAEVIVFPIVHDDREALELAFNEALEVADVLVVNGGSAVGAEDFNVTMIENRGKVVHHYIAAVPGRPLMLAVVDGKPVVDLPGPTLAAYYGTQWCLQAIAARILGIPVRKLPTIELTAPVQVSAPLQLANIGRFDIKRDNSGEYKLKVYPTRGGNMGALMASNAQRISAIGDDGFNEGDRVTFELLRGEEFL